MRGIIFLAVLGIVCGAPTENGHILCEVCHLLVGQVQTLVKGGETKGTIQDYVNSVCDRLPGDSKDVCRAFIKDNSATLFAKLVNDLTPVQLCEKLTGVCPKIDVILDQVPEEEPVEIQDLVVHQIPSPLISEAVEENVEGPLECELCKLVILAVDKLIKTNRSEAAINVTLEKFCTSLPESLADTCHRIEPDLLKALSLGLDPSVACKLVKLCTLSDKVEDIEQIPCDVCYTVMDAIGIQDPEAICAPTKTCKQEDENRKNNSPEEVDDTLECQVCKFAVQAIDGLLGENKTIAAVNSTLINLCSDLPGELKDTCLNVEPDILKAAIGGIDPSIACDFVKACQSYYVVPVSPAYIPCDVCKNTLEAVAAERGVDLCYQIPKVCESEKEPEYVLPKSVVNKCTMCQFFVKSVVDLVQSDESHEAITSTAEQICDMMPQHEKTFCEEYGGDVIEYVKDGGRNEIASCGMLKVCEEIEIEPTTSAIEMEPETIEEIEPIHASEDARCELCKFMITFIDQLVKDNATIVKLNETLSGVCNVVPANFKTTCLTLVPVILSAIQQGLAPEQTCTSASFCTNATEWRDLPELSCDLCYQIAELIQSETSNKADEIESVCTGYDKCLTRSRRSVNLVDLAVSQLEITVKNTNLGGVLECELCKVLIRTIDNMAGENDSIEKVNETLFEVCSKLSGVQLQQMCLQDYPKVLALLSLGIDPDSACKATKLCDSAIESNKITAERKEELKEVESDRNLGDLKCDICTEVVKLLDSRLAENATDEKINETLINLCSSLPSGSLQTICIGDAPEILKALEDGFDPDKTCALAKLCSSQQSKKVSHLFDMSDEDIKKSKQTRSQESGGTVRDLKCELCRDIIDKIDNILTVNSTDEQINATVYQVCAELPGALEDLCLQAAPQIVSTLVKGVNSSIVCEEIGLCTSFIGLRNTDVNVKHNVRDLKCELCRDIIDKIDNILTENSTDEQINATVYQVCAELPGALEDLCLQAAPQIVSTLVKGVNSSVVCEEIGLCTSFIGERNTDVNVKHNVGDQNCDLCKEVVKLVDSFLENNATDEKINATLIQLCSSLPEQNLKEMCLTFIPELMAVLDNGFDPEQACELAGICTKNESHKYDEKSTIFKALSGKRFVTKKAVTLTCELCKGVIAELDSVLAQNETDKKLNETLYQLCSGLPETLKTTCLGFAPKIYSVMVSGVDPKTACDTIGLCDTNADFNKEADMEQNTGNLKDLKCQLCKGIMTELDVIIENNGTAEKINETLLQICSELPGAFQDMCLQYAPQLVSALAQGVDPTAACDFIQMCDTSVKVKTKTMAVQEKVGYGDDLKCELCKDVIKEIDAVIANNASDEQINSTVYKLCGELSGSLESLCLSFAPTLVSEIINGVDPTEACDVIKACTSSAEIEETHSKPTADVECELCEYLVDGLDDILKNNRSVAAINSTVYKLCAGVPAPKDVVCYMIAPALVAELSKGLPPQTACINIHLCPKKTDSAIADIKTSKLDCDMCMTSMQFVYDDVINNYEKIRMPLLMLCHKLPNLYRSECAAAVKSDNGRYLKQILQNYSPSLLCEMAACTEKDGSARIGNKS